MDVSLCVCNCMKCKTFQLGRFTWLRPFKRDKEYYNQFSNHNHKLIILARFYDVDPGEVSRKDVHGNVQILPCVFVGLKVLLS